MPKLLLYDSEINAFVGEKAGSGMSESMDMNSLLYTPFYSVSAGEFSYVASAKTVAFVTREKESLVIVGPGGCPTINLPTCLPINSDDPTLSSLSFEYSDGALFRIDVRHPEIDNLVAPKLSTESK